MAEYTNSWTGKPLRLAQFVVPSASALAPEDAAHARVQAYLAGPATTENHHMWPAARAYTAARVTAGKAAAARPLECGEVLGMYGGKLCRANKITKYFGRAGREASWWLTTTIDAPEMCLVGMAPGVEEGNVLATIPSPGARHKANVYAVAVAWQGLPRMVYVTVATVRAGDSLYVSCTSQEPSSSHESSSEVEMDIDASSSEAGMDVDDAEEEDMTCCGWKDKQGFPCERQSVTPGLTRAQRTAASCQEHLCTECCSRRVADGCQGLCDDCRVGRHACCRPGCDEPGVYCTSKSNQWYCDKNHACVQCKEEGRAPPNMARPKRRTCSACSHERADKDMDAGIQPCHFFPHARDRRQRDRRWGPDERALAVGTVRLGEQGWRAVHDQGAKDSRQGGSLGCLLRAASLRGLQEAQESQYAARVWPMHREARGAETGRACQASRKGGSHTCATAASCGTCGGASWRAS